MIADPRFDAGRFRAPADDAVGVLLEEGIGGKLASLAAGGAEEIGGDAWICGRTTMQRHFAAISVDTRGKLRWAKGSLGGDHLICVLSEQAPADYLDLLREKGISYVVCGESSVDLAQAVALLGEHFGIRTLLLEGGGRINGAFLEAGLVDELSLLLVPGIDGRREVPAVLGVGEQRNKMRSSAFCSKSKVQ